MKKSAVLKTLVLLSATFVLFQIISVSFIFNDTKRETSKSEEFIQDYKRLKIPLILLELELLTYNYSNSELQKVLHHRNYLTFGLLPIHHADIEKHKNHFERSGFSIIPSRRNFTRPSQEVSSHIFLVHEQLTIHIVIFFARTPELVWSTHVGVDTLSKLNSHIGNKPFVEYAYLFKRFELIHKDSILIPSPLDEFVKSIQSSRFIECNETRARLFRDQYPPENNEEAQAFQRKARQIIARAKRYLDDLDIQFWLSSGTCLGWYRQCDIITYSKDVDFGIWIKDFKPQLIPVFEHGGFFLKHIFGKVSDSYELSFQAGDIKLDLFFFYEEDSSMWNGGTHHETGQKYKYTFPKFSLCWTEFLELYVRVPCPPRPYIEANYGKNWNEPVKHWDWDKSPPNVKKNGFWDKDEWMDVIQVF